MAKSKAAAAAAALVALLLAAALAPSFAQAPSGFLANLNNNNQQPPADPNAAPASSSGCSSAPARVVISSVVPVATAAAPASVTLRNAGGATADVTSVVLVDGAGNEQTFPFEECEGRKDIAPGASRTFTPKSETNPCGLTLPLAANGSLSVKNSDAPVAAWANAPPGAQLVLLADGKTYQAFPGSTADVIGVLRAAGNYRTLLAALEATGIAKDLAAPSDPAYVAPDPDAEAAEEAAAGNLAFPSWFADAQPTAAAPPPTRPPKMGEEGGPIAPVGIPAAGPFTIFAPDDDAFNALLTTLGSNGRRLPREALLRRPELRSILEYHVVPGLYGTTAMRNNTPLWTARGVEMVSFSGDPCAGGVPTAGRLSLTDTCLNKPTPDSFTCQQQKDFDKCDFPFMSSALAAQWAGGFCGRACERCSCNPADGGAPCAEVAVSDLAASNGVVHGITRVLLPPPKFTKQAALEQAAAYNATLATGGGVGAGAGGLAADPSGALVLPGAAAGAVAPVAAGPVDAGAAAAVPPGAAVAAVPPAGAGAGAAVAADPAAAAAAAVPPAAPQPSLLVGGAGRRRLRRA